MPQFNPTTFGDRGLGHLAGLSVAGMISSVPDFSLALSFLLTWFTPYALGTKMVSYLVLVMLFEFIVVHSAGFMGFTLVSDLPKLRKSLAVIGLGLFYTMFVGAFAWGFKEWWPLAAFWTMIANRLLSILLGQAPTEKQRSMVMTSWGFQVACYLAFVFLTVLAPIPAFGIDEDVIRAQNFEGGGLWLEEPHRVMAFGFLYFMSIGLFEVLSFRKSLDAE